MRPDRDGDRIGMLASIDAEFAAITRMAARQTIEQAAENAKHDLRMCAIEADHLGQHEAAACFRTAIAAVEDGRDEL